MIASMSPMAVLLILLLRRPLTISNPSQPVVDLTQKSNTVNFTESDSALNELNGPPESMDAAIGSVAAPKPAMNIQSPIRDLVLTPQGVARSAQFPEYDALEETEANIAFFLQLSKATLPLAPRLMTKLWRSNNVYVVHVDAKTRESTYKRFTSSYTGKKYSNVYFLPRESITYMGISMLLNTLSAMELLLTVPQQWDYFINLSGSDYPTVSVENMRKLLGQPRVLQQGVSFMQLAPNKQFWDKMKASRFDKQFFDPLLVQRKDSPAMVNTLIYTGKPHPLPKVELTFLQAEAWIVGHRNLVQAAVRGTFARRLLVLLANMKDPEEHFFPMLAWNDHSLNRTLAHHAMRAIYWHLNGVSSGQHPMFVEEHKTADGSFEFWPKIKRAPVMFVRKFKTPDSPLMDLIDQYKSGVHPDADQKSVDEACRKLQHMTMCQADIELHWNSELVVHCYKGGNLKKN